MLKRKKIKLRAWGQPSRKIMTMVIPSKKEKLSKRSAKKQQLKKELMEYEK